MGGGLSFSLLSAALELVGVVLVLFGFRLCTHLFAFLPYLHFPRLSSLLRTYMLHSHAPIVIIKYSVIVKCGSDAGRHHLPLKIFSPSVTLRRKLPIQK